MRGDEVRALKETKVFNVARIRELTAEETQEFDRLEREVRLADVRLGGPDTPATFNARGAEPESDGIASYRSFRSKNGDGVELRANSEADYGDSFWAYVSARDMREVDADEFDVLSKASNAAGAFL